LHAPCRRVSADLFDRIAKLRLDDALLVEPDRNLPAHQQRRRGLGRRGEERSKRRSQAVVDDVALEALARDVRCGLNDAAQRQSTKAAMGLDQTGDQARHADRETAE
jgi:hypothetical protein